MEAPQLESEGFFWRTYFGEAERLTSSDTYSIEFQGVEAGQKGVVVAIPLFETATDARYAAPWGRIAGVILCTLHPDTIIGRFVAPVRPTQTGHALLIDDKYNMLWSAYGSLFGRDFFEESEAFPAFQRVLESMNAGNSGAAEYSYYRFEESRSLLRPRPRRHPSANCWA